MTPSGIRCGSSPLSGRQPDRTARPERSSTTSSFCAGGTPLSLPLAIFLGHAPRAWSVTGRDGLGFVGEEHAVLDVAALGDCAQCGGAVEAPVDLGPPVATERAANCHVAS